MKPCKFRKFTSKWGEIRLGDKSIKVRTFVCGAKRCRRIKYDCDGWIREDK